MALPSTLKWSLLGAAVLFCYKLACELTVAQLGMLLLATSAVPVILLAYGAYPIFVQWRYYSHLPGPVPHVFLGNLPEYSKAGYHRFHEAMLAKHGRVVKMILGRQQVLLVSDPELVYQAGVKLHSIFHDRPKPVTALRKSKGLLFSVGSYWRNMRRVVAPAFNTGNLKAFTPMMHEGAAVLVERLAALKSDKSIDIWTWIGAMTLEVIGTSAFGTKVPSQTNPDHDLVKAVAAVFSNSGVSQSRVTALVFAFPFLWNVLKRLPSKRLDDVRRALATLDSTSLGIAEKRRRENTAGRQGDFVDLLLAARSKSTGAALTNAEIRDNCNTFFLAGYETTANTLSFLVYCISRNPDAERKLCEEIDRLCLDGALPAYDELKNFVYVDACIQEALRLFPPGAQAARVANENVMLGEHLIHKGTSIVFPIYAMHRNPELFPHPTRYRPERFMDGDAEGAARHRCAHMPFGVGPRNCIGMRFAMEEAKITVVALYKRFTFRLAAPTVDEEPLKLQPNITLGPKNGVHVTVHKRVA